MAGSNRAAAAHGALPALFSQGRSKAPPADGWNHIVSVLKSYQTASSLGFKYPEGEVSRIARAPHLPIDVPNSLSRAPEMWAATPKPYPAPYSRYKSGPDPWVLHPGDLQPFLRGRQSVPVVATMIDRAKVGPYFNPETGATTELHGGPGTAMHPDIYGFAAHAHATKGAATKTINAARESGGLVLTYAGAPEAVLSSNHATQVLMAEINAALRDGGIPKSHLIDLLNGSFEHVKIKPVRSLQEAERVVRRLTMPTRNKFMQSVLRNKSSGLPNVRTVLDLMTDPGLMHARLGDSLSMLYVDPAGPRFRPESFGLPPHPAYAWMVPGINLGRTNPVNILDLFDHESLFPPKEVFKAMGQAVSPAGRTEIYPEWRYTLERVGPVAHVPKERIKLLPPNR